MNKKYIINIQGLELDHVSHNYYNAYRAKVAIKR